MNTTQSPLEPQCLWCYIVQYLYKKQYYVLDDCIQQHGFMI